MRIPVRKSAWWVLYHRSDLMWSVFFGSISTVALFVLAAKNMAKSPAGIVFFTAGVYAAYFSLSSSRKLWKEWTR